MTLTTLRDSFGAIVAVTRTFRVFAGSHRIMQLIKWDSKATSQDIESNSNYSSARQPSAISIESKIN